MKIPWKCLNVDSDNESEDEVDETKEIQIEEALKLYQTALRYHSEGPASYAAAADAYKALFESEIFKYAESLSEFKRHELYGDTLVFDTILEDEFDPSPAQPTGTNESAPNTLHQILHLSYKNHGQFMLQSMQHWITVHGLRPQSEATAQVLGALSQFAEALDKDDTDLDLWLRTASVAALLGSPRITRFCLESVLDGDDDLLNAVMRLPGLEEGFAGQQLVDLVHKLEDTVTIMQPPISIMRHKKLSSALKKRLNPYSFAPLPSEVAQRPTLASMLKQADQISLHPSKWDWAGVADAILQACRGEQAGLFEAPPGCAIAFSMPADVIEVEPNQPDEEAVQEVTGEGELDKAPDAPPLEANAASPAAETVVPKNEEDQDVEMREDSPDAEAQIQAESEQANETTPPVPSRKRSTDSAGLAETAEGGRSRSKRIRARDSIMTDGNVAPDTASQDLAKHIEDQMAPFIEADHVLYQIINDILERFGIETMGSPEELRSLLTGDRSEDAACDSRDKAARDLFTALTSGGPEIARGWVINVPVDMGVSPETGLTAFLGYSKTSASQSDPKPLLTDQRLADFASRMNQGWFSLKEVAFAWLETLLSPDSFPYPMEDVESAEVSTSSYMQYRWAEDLKRHLVQLLINFDDYFYEEFVTRISKIDAAILRLCSQSSDYTFSSWDMAQVEMVETIFELHLDVYSLIKAPRSGVDAPTQVSQKDRLARWTCLARDAIQLRSSCSSGVVLDQLALRHIWASVFLLSVNDEIAADFVIASMQELKATFEAAGAPVIDVHNNAVMPELSIAAVDQELARINMKDFFLKVFDQENKDPVSVIEHLEPILDPVLSPSHGLGDEDADRRDSRSSSTMSHSDQANESPASPSEEMRRFLATAELDLILNLWQRLRDAYESIEYPAKVVSCYLRSIETLVSDLKASKFAQHPDSVRHVKVMRSLRYVDEIFIKVLQIIKSDKTAFDCLTYEQLQASMQALGDLLRILTAANLQEDMVRVGQISAPRFEGFHHTTYPTIMTRLHDMQMRAWILQYHLLKEGLSQNAAAFPTPSEDRFEFLRHVHYATGVRGFCHAAGRTFLRLAKDELLLLDDVIDGNTRDNEVAQVLNDLYGLKLFIHSKDCLDFGSNPETLDKKTSLQLLSFVLAQARKINSKDLPKQTDFKASIDKIHGSLGRPKTNEDISTNRKIVTTFLRSPINPIALFECLKGVGSLSTKQIPPEAAVAASKGWHFLMGSIALNKFRSVKRLNPGPTEDLNFAQAFFLQDLEFSIDRWETWYRLAQANDSQLAECVTWAADKLNSNSLELINYQRAAIHCYAMATACAIRNADAAPQTLSKVSDMYSDFGTRVYASSREPFCMNAFDIKDNEKRVLSSHTTQIIFEDAPFNALRPYSAFKLASVLFKRAIAGKPDKWWSHYMLAKCLWKMYNKKPQEDAYRAYLAAQRGEEARQVAGPKREEVVSAIVNAINALPEKRERGRDPILEPHYKLVSFVHKLVQRKDIDYKEGEQVLQNTSYAQGIRGPDDADDWERYILNVLKALRAADKQSWHHRMIARTAHILYDETRDTVVARAAKHELQQQMFTKTMIVQAWRSDNERPGRHFVYTSRYVRFMAQLLDQTDDKANMDLLCKRIRKRNNDFFEHTKLWQDVCLQYLRMLRRIGQVPEGHEDAVFKSINLDEFAVFAGRLEAWCQHPQTQHQVLDALRDVIELKRLNNGLMKALVIDDLIGDAYAVLYASIGPTLPPLPSEQASQPQPPSNVGNSGQAGSGPLSMTPMAPSQLDGASESTMNIAQPPTTYQLAVHTHGVPSDPAPRSRTKNIGRREIQRRAEAACTRPAAPTPAVASATTTMTILSPPTTHPQVIVPISSPEKKDRIVPSKDESSSTKPTMNEHLPVPLSGTATTAGSAANLESSAPASIQDDADDESDLSELDEEEVRDLQEEANFHDPLRQSQSQSSGSA